MAGKKFAADRALYLFVPASMPFISMSRDKLAQEFIDACYDSWQTHGAAALDRMATETPAEVVRADGQLDSAAFRFGATKIHPGYNMAREPSMRVNCLRGSRSQIYSVTK